MEILLGDTRSRKLLADMRRFGWGRLMVAAQFEPYPGEPWGLDNGLFAATKKGETWDMFRFVSLLGKLATSPPLFACLPDRPQIGGGENTPEGSLFRSLLWWDRLLCRSAFASWRWLLAVQDGMTVESVENAWSAGIGGIFLGGSNRYKAETAATWCEWAHSRGLWFHYARAGTPAKFHHAERIGADSIDTTSPLHCMQDWRAWVRLVTEPNPQLELLAA